MTDGKDDLKLLFISTGGTIGTMVAGDGKRRLAEEGSGAEPMLLKTLRSRYPELKFRAEVRLPYQVLSEHMTTAYLEKLAAALRAEELSSYDGLLITHGSDTLAFTAAFLGELLQGCPVPVFLLATQLPIEDPGSNGIENTRAAMELLKSGKAGGGTAPVYVAYRNSDGVMYLHHAGELRQCAPGTDDFFSAGMQGLEQGELGYLWPEAFDEPDDGADRSLWQVPPVHFSGDVLLLHPYVGLPYDRISLSGIGKVLHTLYHLPFPV